MQAGEGSGHLCPEGREGGVWAASPSLSIPFPYFFRAKESFAHSWSPGASWSFQVLGLPGPHKGVWGEQHPHLLCSRACLDLDESGPALWASQPVRSCKAFALSRLPPAAVKGESALAVWFRVGVRWEGGGWKPEPDLIPSKYNSNCCLEMCAVCRGSGVSLRLVSHGSPTAAKGALG